MDTVIALVSSHVMAYHTSTRYYVHYVGLICDGIKCTI